MRSKINIEFPNTFDALKNEKKIETESIVIEDTQAAIKPIGFFEYCKLQMEALCVISDSEP